MTTRSTDKSRSYTREGIDSPSESRKSGEQKSPARGKGGSEWTRDVLSAIIREARGGSVKHQELFLKYKNHFDLPDGEEDPSEIIYEARFVDDTTKDPEAL